MATDPRTIPQALRVATPQSVDTSGIVAQLKADAFGALWLSLADPINGLALLTTTVANDVAVGGADRALVTMSAVYAWDEINSNSMRACNAAPNSALGATDPIVFARGLACTSILHVRDLVAGAFQPVDRGLLNADALDTTRNAQLTAAAMQALSPMSGLYDRLRCFGVDVDTLAASATGYLGTLAVPSVWNGASFDRAGSASAPNLATQSGTRAALAAHPGEWTLTSAPAANTIATATRAAGAAGVRHVLRSINATLIGVGAIAAPILVVVRDGATGVGPILWQDQLFAAAAGSKDRVTLTGLNIVGSAATAMTVEFVAAPGATNFEAIAATGYSSAAQAA